MNGKKLVLNKNHNIKLGWYIKVFLLIEIAMLCFMGIFYFACGKTLYERSSDGNIEEFTPTNDTGEVLVGGSVEQTYTSEMDKIVSIGVMVSNYGQPYTSHLYVKCEDVTDGHMVAEGTFDVNQIGVNQYVYLTLPDNSDIMRGDLVKIIVTSDAETGNAPTVLYNIGYEFEKASVGSNASMLVNGGYLPGTMCITVEGDNYVWTGPNYWKLVVIAIIFVAIIYWILAARAMRGKVSYFFGIFSILKKYGFLIKQLVSRDFKTRYKKSVLGVFWSFLNPLLMMLVQYVVFSQLFKADIDNYAGYLLCGTVAFNFFSEGVGQSLTSIVGNAPLITKVYLPKYIYPITRVLSSGINLLMSLIPLVIVALMTGEKITRSYLMLPYVFITLMLFTMGFGMIMASAMTFFRDMQFLWGVLSMIWMYVTPMFYPISIIPKEVRGYFGLNPMYHYVEAVRSIILNGITPKPIEFAIITGWALIMFVIGAFIFKRTQDKFIFYI